ncbi:bifunctional riboflavin kinase/FAD synthetase [Tindallia californiensis]|uniref:Riboflavin biosynthesis protein n=1 Tax=Tindallia californiensis TaxID=159292 RepID=A0A1H3NPA6_9FIRM|nr:bifunctional riboflavin kinase/FAD synthetase [Tindallia californiensis]SDY90510.1 riboflavin kinase / FMN adenylyltransferase [Tindallia californiensis]
MRVIEDYHQVLNDFSPKGVALGNFDGIHRGHQSLLKILKNECAKRNLLPTVYTFQNHPGTILKSCNRSVYPYKITPINLKEKIMDKLGVDLLFLDKFTQDLMHLSPSEFAKTILVDRLKAKLIVVGEDFRFGYQASGDVDLLSRLGEILGFHVIIAPPVLEKDIKISSSLIRDSIEKGDIELANQLLGRPFMMLNRVEKGFGRGKKMGFPTANLVLEPYQLIPSEGVYATQVKVDNTVYMGATSVGKNPTFNAHEVTIETYIIDSRLMLYEKNIELYFHTKIRSQISYDNINALKNQILEDVYNIKNYLQNKTTMIL